MSVTAFYLLALSVLFVINDGSLGGSSLRSSFFSTLGVAFGFFSYLVPLVVRAQLGSLVITFLPLPFLIPSLGAELYRLWALIG